MHLYFYRDCYTQELHAQYERARMLAEEVFVPQRRKRRACRRLGYGKYGTALGCDEHSSILNPKVVLDIEARFSDKHLVEAATVSVALEQARQHQQAERLRIWELSQIEAAREAELHKGVGAAAAKELAEECRACGPCNADFDWMFGSRCGVHELRYEEVCANMKSGSQLRLYP